MHALLHNDSQRDIVIYLLLSSITCLYFWADKLHDYACFTGFNVIQDNIQFINFIGFSRLLKFTNGSCFFRFIFLCYHVEKIENPRVNAVYLKKKKCFLSCFIGR